MTPILLLIAGLFLIYLEFYLPGAVMGIAGGLLLLSGIFLAVITYENPLVIAGFILFSLVALAGLIRFALWKIPRTDKSRSIYSADAQEGFQASAFDASAIGKRGEVISDLKPGGYISIEGKQHQAISESGYLTRGTHVYVIRGDGESLIVRKE